MPAQLTESSEQQDLKKAWHILNPLKPKCPDCGYADKDLFQVQRPEYYAYSTYLSTPGSDNDYGDVDTPTLTIDWGNGDWSDGGEETFICRRCGNDLEKYLDTLIETHDLEVQHG